MEVYDSFLKEQLCSQEIGVASYELNQRRVWVKRALKRHPFWVYLPFSFLGHFLRVSALTPVSNRGGRHAIATEVRRLRQLGAKGISVPTILASSPDGILLADVGQTRGGEVQNLRTAMKNATSETEILACIECGARGIRSVHAQGEVLSEAFARNILLINKEDVSFIDFETDPQEYLFFADAVVRDWTCFAFSVMRGLQPFPEAEEAGMELLYSIISEEQKQVCATMDKLGRTLPVLLRFFPLGLLGTEGVRIGRLSTFFSYFHSRYGATHSLEK
ncbi:hypothetical protein [Chitinivibrio alkaliphilus]|uniref:Uncharacterized protein n=1 Tax=Chitinivibrio alkaliphilus ACht1 TaxID=1313304 RepID=U7DDK0_9BACT|nr:hypothetical protein [Chitinivibrio alkaliphilus]ERP38966.1 hypothetical protein CALK_0457 [Chitinivibrio alkaliphilus ACht1]